MWCLAGQMPGGALLYNGVVSVAKLTEKQKRFVAEYLVDLNATDAARRAGYKDPNIGRQLITKNNVSAEIAKRREKLQSKLEITQETVLQELAAIAFANGTDFAAIDKNGCVTLTPTSELSEEKKKAVASIKEGQYGTEVKLHDKVRALELLGKHLGVLDAKGGSASPAAENNLLEAIMNIGEIDTDDLPEVE